MIRLLAALSLLLLAPAALAAPVLQIRPITWDVIGLDSNNVNVGPNLFPIGARVCNTGDAAATNVTATLVRTGLTNPFLTIQGNSTLTTATIPAGGAPASPYTINATPANCADFYFNVIITRTVLAFLTTQGYRIDVTASNAASVSTPNNRQLRIDSLISQNRNSVSSFTGPTSVQIGGIYQYFLTASTATQGYEQLENFPLFPTTIFRILSVSTSYGAPSGAINSTVYADACGWNANVGLMPPLGTYTACTGPQNYSGGKVGGTVTTVYTVQILSAGNENVASVIYDLSGGSYHYNNDFGNAGKNLTITATPPPPVTVVKSRQMVSDPINGVTNPKSIPGARANYSITVSNPAVVALTANSVELTDPIPSGTALRVVDFGGPGSGPVQFTNGSPGSGLSYTFTSLASQTDSIGFSQNGTDFSYVPTADANGVDTTVTHIRISPSGTMAASTGSGDPSFTVTFGVRVK